MVGYPGFQVSSSLIVSPSSLPQFVDRPSHIFQLGEPPAFAAVRLDQLVRLVAVREAHVLAVPDQLLARESTGDRGHEKGFGVRARDAEVGQSLFARAARLDPVAEMPSSDRALDGLGWRREVLRLVPSTPESHCCLDRASPATAWSRSLGQRITKLRFFYSSISSGLNTRK